MGRSEDDRGGMDAGFAQEGPGMVLAGLEPVITSVSGANRDPETRSITPSSRRDIESHIGAWFCVLGSFFSFVTNFCDVGWISGLFLFLSLLINLQVGPVFDVHGPNMLGIIGSVCYTACFLLLAECSKYYQFMLCLGVFGSFSAGLVAVVAVAVVGKLFVRQRGLAMGIALAGSATGSVIFPILFRYTLPKLGWKTSLRITAGLSGGVLLLGMVCLVPYHKLPGVSHSAGHTRQRSSSMNFQAFKSYAFDFVTAGMFMLEFVISSISGLLPTIGMKAGFSQEDSYTLLTIIGSTSFFGRVIPGLVGDRIGHFNILLLSMAFTIIFMGAMLIPFGASVPVLYAFSALWGFGSGSFLSITPVCIGKTCEPQDYGRYYGTMNFVVSFSLLIAIPSSGSMLENIGAQSLSALLMALVFVGALCFYAARVMLIGRVLSLKTKI